MHNEDSAWSPATEPAARRAQLAVLCALDRAALKLAFRTPIKPDKPSESPAGEGLRRALAVGRFLPGAVGRWSRRLSVGAGLLGFLR